MKRMLLAAAVLLVFGMASEATAQNFFNVNPVPGMRPANDGLMRWYGPIYGFPYSYDPRGINYRRSGPPVHYRETMLDPLILQLDGAAPPAPIKEPVEPGRVIIGEIRAFPNRLITTGPRFRR